MSGSKGVADGVIHVRSTLGPARIEVLDERLHQRALGFGELRAHVPAGLYTLQCTAGTAAHEEVVRVKAGAAVEREVELPFPSAAPISASTTTHEFHTMPAEELSRQPTGLYGLGGGLMIFVRTIDADGRARVPVERLSVWNDEVRLVAELAADASRSDAEGWACLSAHVNPGGYTLRYSAGGGLDADGPIDQSLWVAPNWTTIAFVGYESESDHVQRQTASIHMGRLGEAFQPGPYIDNIRNKTAPPSQLKEARVNQALDLALSGLRTGRQVVPDDLLDLLLEAKFQNPMLGIVGAHAIMQRQPRDWQTFDVVVENLEKLIPGHPDVAALRMTGALLRKGNVMMGARLGWPPMLRAGYTALVECDWIGSGDLIVDGSVAERAAGMLLPESPWSCWIALEGPGAEGRLLPGETLKIVKHFGSPVLKHDPISEVEGPRAEQPEADLVLERVIRHIGYLADASDETDPRVLSIQDFRQLGLPVAAVQRALATLSQRGRTREPASAEPSKPLVYVGTFGHDTHGKTTLTSALTKVSAERLANVPEEDATRGTELPRAPETVEYATATRRYAHVDYPASADRLPALIVAAASMDGAILVVSAVDGPMPQTREHLLLARELGVPSVVVALTKIDAVEDQEVLDLTELEVRELLSAYGYAGDEVPVVPVSALAALRGDATAVQGIVALMDALDHYIPLPQPQVDKPFMMSIEDVFSLSGRGTLVVGRIERGRVQAGDEVEIVGRGPTVRVVVTAVGISMAPRAAGVAGERVDLLLRDVKKSDLEKGQVLAAPGSIKAYTRFSARVYVVPKDERGEGLPLVAGYRPSFHLRAAGVDGTISLSEGADAILPGTAGVISVELAQAVPLETGLSIMLREGGRMLAAGTVTALVE